MNLISKTDAAEILGLPLKKFNLLEIEPISRYINPHNKKLFIYLYDKAYIESLKDVEKVKSLIPKKRDPKDWNGIFYSKYTAANDTKAISDVCQALFNLNRYAKHGTCSKSNKEEIYSLKNDVVRILYQAGYCISTTRHIKETDSRECRYCYGPGLRQGNECYDCDGMGTVNLDPYRFIVFVFNVNNERYVWHQPEERIQFSIQVGEDSEEINETEVKPINIPKNGLSEGKALLRWFISNNK